MGNTMSLSNKISLTTLGLISVATLAACQSTPNMQSKDHPRDMKYHEMKKHHAKYADDRHQKMHGKHRALYAQMQKACEQKAVGSVIQVQVGEKQIQGSCNIYFKADRGQMKSKRGNDHTAQNARPMRADASYRGQTRHEALTDEKRAELTQQYAQRLALKQAKQQAMLKACQGQTNGKAVQIKVAEQTMNGTCVVKFTPEAPAKA